MRFDSVKPHAAGALALLLASGCDPTYSPSAERARVRAMKACDQQPHPSTPRQAEYDIGPPFPTMRRYGRWAFQEMYLGDTCYVAWIGPHYWEEEPSGPPGFYELEVVRPMTAEGRRAWDVVFMRQLPVNELGSGFERWNIADVVSYDAATRSVRFDLRKQVYEYRLPPDYTRR